MRYLGKTISDFPGSVFGIETIAQSLEKKIFSDQNLRLCILTFDPAHIKTSCFFKMYVHQSNQIFIINSSTINALSLSLLYSTWVSVGQDIYDSHSSLNHQETDIEKAYPGWNISAEQLHKRPYGSEAISFLAFKRPKLWFIAVSNKSTRSLSSSRVNMQHPCEQTGIKYFFR